MSLFIRILRIALGLDLTTLSVPAFPLGLFSTPKQAEVIDFVLQRQFAFRPLPRDIAKDPVSAKYGTRPIRPLSVGSGLDSFRFSHGVIFLIPTLFALSE